MTVVTGGEMASFFNAVASIFSGPSKAAAPAAVYTPPPTQADPSVQAAARAQAVATANAAGRESTLLTGGQGDTSQPSIASKTLLGQ